MRDESGNVEIRKYVVQSPEMLMTARGGISYTDRFAVLPSPPQMDSQLDLRGRGAAIFYDLDLLQDERDAYGYWTGPAIKFWGTVAQSESNLSEIIETAGKGAVLGGLTRPISGLIGTVRHLWMDEEGEPIEVTDEPQAAPAETVEEAPGAVPGEVPAKASRDEPARKSYLEDLPDYYE